MTYTPYLTTCDGADSTIVTDLHCSVHVDALTTAPYSLAWGSPVFAIVSAQNVKGTSEYSTEGGAAVILTNPDAPLNLADNPAQTSGSVIALVWNVGAQDGGSPVIDYTLSYDEGTATESFVVVASGILDKNYLVSSNLTPGVTYTFKVQSRNVFGLSEYSAPVSVLAA